MCGEEVNIYRVLVGIPEGKISLRWPRPRCDGNIKMDLKNKRMEGHGLRIGQMAGSFKYDIGLSVLI